MNKRHFIAAAFSVLLLSFLLCTSALADEVLRQTPYTMSIPEGTPIYGGPNGAARVGTVSEDGVYTIVAQSCDNYGIFWGRLKSGAGWVRLSPEPADSPASPSAGLLAVPYSRYLPSGTVIFHGPGAAYGQAYTIETGGFYSIAAEQCDTDGSVWGRQESGGGWVWLRPGRQPVPYDIALGASVELHWGPSYDSGFRGLQDHDGIRRVHEEYTDSEGILWGRLDEEGLCWVDLSALRCEKVFSPISIKLADAQLLEGDSYLFLSDDSSPYTLKTAFRANEELRSFALAALEPGTLVPDRILCTLEKLSPSQPLVAELSFPGDLSCFAVSFTDGDGVQRLYRIYLSGRNGTLTFEEEPG